MESSEELEFAGDVTLVSILQSEGKETVSEEAAQQFFDRYMQKLVSLVQRNLASRYSTRLDPEDVVQSVFRSWFNDAKEGKITAATESEIWKLLSVIALNKVRNKIKFHDAQRRSVVRTSDNADAIAAVPEPTERDAEDFLDIVETVGQKLDDKARRTLELLLEGYSVTEIADELGRTTKSISRYKKQIGAILHQFLGANSFEE